MARRETNKERRERERKRGDLVFLAKCVIAQIRAARKKLLSRDELAELGRIFCFLDMDHLRVIVDILEDEPQSLEDEILAQPRHSYTPRENGSYVVEIGNAYIKALYNVWETLPPGFSTKNLPDNDMPFPTFPDFLDIFREQNPRLKGASDRSLRRSLQRLGYRIRPAKRGPRPLEK